MNSSILWIFLIAAWLFILLPMVLRGRPEVKKTTEAVANTRLLHRGGSAAAARRRAGRHPSDPKYVRTPSEPVLKRAEPEEADVPENDADQNDAAQDDADGIAADVVEAVDAETEVEVTDVIDAVSDDLDADDLDADDGQDPDDDLDAEAEFEEDEDADDEGGADAEADDDLEDHDEWDELDDFTPIDEELPVRKTLERPSREERGRGVYTPERIAERDAKRYRDRRRTSAGLIAATVLAVASCFFWQPYGFIAAAAMVVLLGLYLFFLRRTALAEQQFRAQRAARLRRHAAEDERLRREQEAQLPVRGTARARRRPGGMIVLELDDEDPSFDHLPLYDFTYASSADTVDDEYRHAG